MTNESQKEVKKTPPFHHFPYSSTQWEETKKIGQHELDKISIDMFKILPYNQFNFDHLIFYNLKLIITFSLTARNKKMH